MGCFWIFLLVWWLCVQEDHERCERRRHMNDLDDDDC